MIVGRTFNIKTDSVDTRDYIYRPSLQVLAPRFLCAVLSNPLERENQTLRIRDQKQRSTCVGEALAAVIDIQRYENLARARNAEGAVSFVPTSSAMLDRMARSIESAEPGSAGGILSLRSALRGFYNCGVATQADWPDDSGMMFDQITDKIAESARQLGLGAYYRLDNVLNDYHAALHEAGALLVSANIHGGWASPRDGILTIGQGAAGTIHAFVIVGYTEAGFLVLNSFGRGWGGFKFDGESPLAGVALWSYEDWAGSVRDAWVLRLAVPTPNSFRFTVGSYGKSGERAGGSAIAAITRTEAPRRNAVIGRYLTFEEGEFQGSGPYPTTAQTFDTTLSVLQGRDSNDPGAPYYGDIVLVFHGAPEPAEDAIARTQAKILRDKSDGIYRISVLWENSLFNGAATALQPLFDAALVRRSKVGPECDDLIEKLTRPVGRAVWHEVKRQAHQLTANRGRGKATDLVHSVSRLARLCARTGRRLHIVAEGAGAIAAGHLVAHLGTGGRHAKTFLDVLQSVQLAAPTLSRDDLVGLFDPVLKRSRAGRPLITVFKPDSGFERRLAVSPYSKSWANLIQRAFEDPGTALINLGDAPSILHPAVREIVLAAPASPLQTAPLPLASLMDHPDADAYLRSRVRAARTLKRNNIIQASDGIPGDLEYKSGGLHSIHIGVDKLDRSYYGPLTPLEGCVNDARAFEALAGKLGGTDSRLLLDEKATRAAVVVAIHEKARELRPGDTLLLTYSGHGNTAQDSSGDELSGLDSTWCVHDGEILDDELAVLWATFRAGVDIVVFSDSCHSGSVIAAPRVRPPPVAGRGAVRRLPAPAENLIVRNRRFQARQSLASILDANLPAAPIAASVTLLSACLDDQLAYEVAAKPAGGAFTRVVVSILGEDPDLSAKQLHTAALKGLSGQTPNLMRLGAHKASGLAGPVLGKITTAGSAPTKPKRNKPEMLARPRGLVSTHLAFPYSDAFDLDLRLKGQLDDPELGELLSASQDKLSRIGRTVARVFVESTRIGTGFILSPSLVATNAHVAARFTYGRFWSNKPVTFKLAEGPFNPFPVADQQVELAWMPPVPAEGDPVSLDLALIKLPTPLPSAAAGMCDFTSVCSVGDPIAVIGFPGKAKGNTKAEVENLFRGEGIGNYWDHMWLSPGRIRFAPGTSGPGDFTDPNGWIARYDANTTPGNSGSMIVSLTTCKIIGIHAASDRWEANFGYIFSRAGEINPEVPQMVEADYAEQNSVPSNS